MLASFRGVVFHEELCVLLAFSFLNKRRKKKHNKACSLGAWVPSLFLIRARGVLERLREVNHRGLRRVPSQPSRVLWGEHCPGRLRAGGVGVLNARPPHKALGLVQAAPLDVLARLPSRRSLLKTEHTTAELRVPCCRQGSEVSGLNSMNINHLSEPINQRGTGGGGPVSAGGAPGGRH